MPIERFLCDQIALLKHPYPYKGMLCVASDCDGMSLETFEHLHTFMNSEQMTKWGQGVGLDIADSMWVYSPATKTIISQRIFSMKNGMTVDADEEMAPIIAKYVHCGWIDTLHTLGDFNKHTPSRELAEYAVQLFYRYGIGTPVWIDHGGNSNIQNLCQRPWSHGSKPGRDCFLADLLPDFGVRYYNHFNSVGGIDYRACNDLTFLDLAGTSAWGFSRWFCAWVSELPNTSGVYRFASRNEENDTAKLWHPTALHHQLNKHALDLISKENHTIIVGQHLGHLGLIPRQDNRPISVNDYPPTAIAALRLLRDYQDQGTILVARTARLLEFMRVKKTAKFTIKQNADSTMIDCNLIREPNGALHKLDLETTRGLTFVSKEQKEIRISLGGLPLDTRFVTQKKLESPNQQGFLTMVNWHEKDTTNYADM